MGPGSLEQVLLPFADHTHPDLLVGLHSADDAAVYRVAHDQAIIQTIDFFPPIVDDPYQFGQIAAANAMSDIFAMGGSVLFALNIAAFPEDLSRDIVAAIFQGGADKVREAGGVIAGGHTVIDSEPKYGLTVTGMVRPDRLIRKSGLRPGDVLVITKSLGTGVITTALRAGGADPEHVAGATASMSRLNRVASLVAVEMGIEGGTDITGFGLLGHSVEMARAGTVRLHIDVDRIPWLAGTASYAESGFLPGGLHRNRDYFKSAVIASEGLSSTTLDLLYDPETSGGLLLGVRPDQISDFQRAMNAAGESATVIGVVQSVGAEGPGINLEAGTLPG